MASGSRMHRATVSCSSSVDDGTARTRSAAVHGVAVDEGLISGSRVCPECPESPRKNRSNGPSCWSRYSGKEPGVALVVVGDRLYFRRQRVLQHFLRVVGVWHRVRLGGRFPAEGGDLVCEELCVALFVANFRLEEGSQFPAVRSGELRRVVGVNQDRLIFPGQVVVETLDKGLPVHSC